MVKNASPAREKMVVEMYAQGLATRDIEEQLKTQTSDQLDGRPLLSRWAASDLTDALLERTPATGLL